MSYLIMVLRHIILKPSIAGRWEEIKEILNRVKSNNVHDFSKSFSDDTIDVRVPKNMTLESVSRKMLTIRKEISYGYYSEPDIQIVKGNEMLLFSVGGVVPTRDPNHIVSEFIEEIEKCITMSGDLRKSGSSLKRQQIDSLISSVEALVESICCLSNRGKNK